LEALFTELLEWVRAHPFWAGIVLYAIALAESLAIVGVVVPGVVIMFGIGALIGAGAADFWIMCVWAIAGAVTGDGLSYWLGHRYRMRLRDMWPFRRMPETLEQGQRFFERHGALSIVFGRFFGPVRATVPLVAGMLDMPSGRFIAANVGSAILWAPAYLMPGVVFGASLELASEVAFRLVLVVLVIVALSWFTGWLVHRVFRWLQPRTNDLLHRVLRFGERHAWLRRIAEAIANPGHPEARGLSAFGAILVLTALALALISALLPTNIAWASADRFAADAITSLQTQTADRLVSMIATQTETRYLAAIGLGVAALLIVYRRLLALWHWLGGLAGAVIGFFILQWTAPVFALGHLTPDGNTLIAAAPLGLVAVMCAPAIGERYRWSVYATCTILVVLALFGRLYLELTTLSSVFTGVLLSAMWIAGLGVAYRTHSQAIPLSGLQAAGILTVAGAALIATGLLAPSTPAQKPPPEVITVEERAWRTSLWRDLPQMRDDLRESSAFPLNVQYAGGIGWLDQRLQESGWHRMAANKPENWLRLLSPSLPLFELPVLPHIHAGRHESAIWIRTTTEGRLVLRLWPSNHAIEGIGPLWLGEASQQIRHERFRIFNYAVTTEGFDEPIRQIAADLPPEHLLKVGAGRLLLSEVANLSPNQ